MIALAGCSASCVFCYLGDGDGSHQDWSVDQFVEAAEALRKRGASCLYLVNPEAAFQKDLRAALFEVRRKAPSFPIVMKLGGHEDLALSNNLRTLVDAISLDAKVFSNADAESFLGVADYPTRFASNLAFWVNQTGFFRPDSNRISGVWIRHLVLPGRAKSWGAGLEAMPDCQDLPVWVSLEYRPFWRARRHPILGSKLNPGERSDALSIVSSLRANGRQLWVE